MLSFSNADEECFKKAVSSNMINKADASGGAASINYTPTSSSGATTMGQSMITNNSML